MPEDEKTAIPGSDPGITAQPGAVPGTGQEGGLPPKADDDKLPFDQHPKWKSARQAEKALQDLMKENECETIEELMEAVVAGRTLLGKQVTPDQLDGLLKKAETLDQYERYWKEQEETKKRQGEEPEDTIRRQEQEIKALKAQQHGEREKEERAREGQQAADAYDNEVKRLVDSLEEVPVPFRKFYYYFFGVENPASSIDITDRKAIRKTVEDGFKVLKEFETAIISNLQTKKGEIPPVPGTGAAGETAPKIKNLREARKTLGDLLSTKFQGG